MAKILFEYLAQEPLDNIATLLYEHYDEVVYFYLPSEPADEARDEALGQFVMEKLGINMQYFEVPEDETDAVLWSFHRVISEHDEKNAMAGAEENTYDVEITGGVEVFLVAAGILLGEERERVGLKEFRLKTKHKENPVYRLSIDDVINLQGRKTVSISDGEKIDFSDKIFRNEVLKLWNAVKDISVDWNRFASLTPVDEVAEPFQFGKTFSGEQDRYSCKRIMEKLAKNQMIADYQIDKTGPNRYLLQYAYTDAAKTRSLYEKSGTVLEMFTALAAHECGIFRDCHSGVQLDADGIITGDQTETRNEIDVLMMWENCPVFVSCKNTRVTKEFIYEIIAMAKHYGGKYAIPVLVSSLDSFPAVAERAEEMGVLLIDHVAEKTLKELKDSMGMISWGRSEAK